jgi:hypothetical protein
MNKATLMLVGDLILDEPDPQSFFAPSRALLRSADLTIGHVEVPHTARAIEQSTDVPAPPWTRWPTPASAPSRWPATTSPTAGHRASRTPSPRCAVLASPPPAPA